MERGKIVLVEKEKKKMAENLRIYMSNQTNKVI